MRGLIAQEWISRHGGSEVVFRAMADAYPDADLVTLWDDLREPIGGRMVRESWLARTPLRRHKAAALPVMPLTWRHLSAGPRDYDWVLTSSHAFAHHLRARSDARLFAYVHTPARYVWDPDADVRGASLPAQAVAKVLRRTDARRATELTRVAANSEFVRARIERHWGLPATVIHPPVDIAAYRAPVDGVDLEPGEAAIVDALPETFLLGMSRFIPYKRLDLVIEAATRCGIPAVIAGDGPELPRLQAMADASTVPCTIVRRPSDALLRTLYRRAACLVFLALEDFGLVPVEAMAVGTPVVANRHGGTAETVIDGVSGFVVDPEDPADVDRGIRAALQLDRASIPATVDRFDRAIFAANLREWMND